MSGMITGLPELQGDPVFLLMDAWPIEQSLCSGGYGMGGKLLKVFSSTFHYRVLGQ